MQKLLHVYYHSENRATSQIWKVLPNMVFPRFGGKNGGVLSMRMQVILDSSFARPGSAPIWGGKKGQFRHWTTITHLNKFFWQEGHRPPKSAGTRMFVTTVEKFIVRLNNKSIKLLLLTTPSFKTSSFKTGLCELC